MNRILSGSHQDELLQHNIFRMVQASMRHLFTAVMRIGTMLGIWNGWRRLL